MFHFNLLLTNWSQTLTGATIGTLWHGYCSKQSPRGWFLPPNHHISKLEKGFKTIIPRALQNGPLFYNCLRAFDHYAKPSDSTSAASHFPSLFYMTTCSKSRDYFKFFFFFWLLGKIDPLDPRNIELNWNGLRKMALCYRILLRLAVFRVAFGQLYESCWSQRHSKNKKTNHKVRRKH